MRSTRRRADGRASVGARPDRGATGPERRSRRRSSRRDGDPQVLIPTIGRPDFCPIGQQARSARSDIDAGRAGPDRGGVGLARLEASGIPRVRPSGCSATAASQRLPASSRAPVGWLDGGSRERWAMGVQRTASNRTTQALAEAAVQRDAAGAATQKPSAWDLGPNPYAIESPGGGAKRRELDANPTPRRTTRSRSRTQGSRRSHSSRGSPAARRSSRRRQRTGGLGRPAGA